MLDHLDADEDVELTLEVLGEITIVHDVNGDLIGKTFRSDTFLSEGFLLHRKRESVDGATVILRSLYECISSAAEGEIEEMKDTYRDSESTPSRTELE